jgi:hypothetical protein
MLFYLGKCFAPVLSREPSVGYLFEFLETVDLVFLIEGIRRVVDLRMVI